MGPSLEMPAGLEAGRWCAGVSPLKGPRFTPSMKLFEVTG